MESIIYIFCLIGFVLIRAFANLQKLLCLFAIDLSVQITAAVIGRLVFWVQKI